MREIIIKADNLHFSYDDGNSHSLNGLSLEIERGKKIAFMGANGSGKSTFFLCCNGVNQPEKGTLYLDGKPLEYTRKGLLEARQKVGIVFQDPDNQLFSASVYQEISFGILNLGVSEETAKKEVEDVIDYLEITPFRHKPTHALSGGQKKQVSIADILVMHPEVIILDEPAAALDPRHTVMVNKIVDELTEKGITVIMSTHDVDYAFSWADQVFLLKDGQVLTEGNPIQVFSNKAALAETNLKQPAVLELFNRLCLKGILKTTLKVPRTLAELESYIENISERTYHGHGGFTPMNEQKNKAILVVSFGTSYEPTRKVTIDAIEKDIAEAFPDYKIYRAWTSKMIIAKLKKRDHIHINNVKEAMAQMASDNITDVIIQPTHVINGIENDLMKEDALSFRNQFNSITFGTPLLTDARDNEAVIHAVAEEFKDLGEDTALVLMGHGTTHFSNSIYAALDYTFKDMGHPHIFLGTVEAYPTMQSLLRIIESFKPKKIVLAPFMIVAGDHARNDMAGDDPESWMCQFQAAGYEVIPVLKGLGEYQGIRRLFLQHIQAAINNSREN